MGVVDPFSVARAAGLELTGKPEGLTLTDGTMELRADFGACFHGSSRAVCSKNCW